MNLTIKTKSFFNILVLCLFSQNCNIVKIEKNDIILTYGKDE